MKKFTITDIAKKLNVSKTTVSFVLNGKGDERNISKETQKRIRDLALLLNYQPSAVAQSLKKGKTNSIGYLVPDISNLFFARIGRKIEDLLLKKGYHLFIGSTDEDPEKELELINSLMSRRVDGLIIASSRIESIKSILKSKFPVVLFDREDENIEANYVLVENKKSMSKAVNELIGSGCSKIGLLSITPDVFSLKQRIEGYENALVANGLEVLPDLIRTVNKNEIKKSVKEQLQFLVEAKVDSIVFTNNLPAQEVIWNLNVHYPELKNKIQLASFDNIDLFDYPSPRVVSLAQPTIEIAENIVSLLINEMESGQVSLERKKVVLEPKLLKRR